MTWIPRYWLDEKRLAEVVNDPSAPQTARIFAQAIPARAKRHDERWEREKPKRPQRPRAKRAPRR